MLCVIIISIVTCIKEVCYIKSVVLIKHLFSTASFNCFSCVRIRYSDSAEDIVSYLKDRVVYDIIPYIILINRMDPQAPSTLGKEPPPNYNLSLNAIYFF